MKVAISLPWVTSEDPSRRRRDDAGSAARAGVRIGQVRSSASREAGVAPAGGASGVDGTSALIKYTGTWLLPGYGTVPQYQCTVATTAYTL